MGIERKGKTDSKDSKVVELIGLGKQLDEKVWGRWSCQGSLIFVAQIIGWTVSRSLNTRDETFW